MCQFKKLINMMYIVKGLRFVVTLDVVFLGSFKIEVIFKSVRRNKQFSLKICEAIFQWHIKEYLLQRNMSC